MSILLNLKLNEKLSKELDNCIKKLKFTSNDEILLNSNEIYLKNEFKVYILGNSYNESEINKLLNEENILDKCYKKYMNSEIKVNKNFLNITNSIIKEIL